MAILGSIIKGVILLKDAVTPEVNHIEAQKDMLVKLLETAKDTQFGKYYQFDSLLESDQIVKEFSNRIPYFDYNKINDEIWNIKVF